MKRINFLWLLLSVVCCLGFISCKGLNEPDNPNVNKDFVYSETGMYVGITGFSDAINFYGSDEWRYHILSNSKPYESFIDGLSMGDATVLYYAVDNNLSYLEKCAFPEDVSSVSIITFTDGLDQGSRALDKQDQNNSYTANNKSYVEAIAEKLQRIKINNIPINAYAIGVRGSDVQGDAVATFENNLLKLSSSKENAMQVSNMDEVNAKFETIAKSLYSKTETHSLTITIPMPSENEKERFTFDDVTDPTKSKCYLEGVYANGALNDIKYVGCQSSSGAKVLETYAGGVKIQFLFENFTDLKGNAISTTKMQQWHIEEGATTWTRNSEFKPTESINVEEKRTSAVVMLILDCSSSLGASDFAKVKTAAKNFIKTLAGEVNNNNNDKNDNNDNNNSNTNDSKPDNSESNYAKVRFKKTDTYSSVPAMYLLDATEENVLIEYEFGSNSGTSPYFWVPAGNAVPVCAYVEDWNTGDVGIYYMLDEPHYYYFNANCAYTIVISDDGTYFTVDVIKDGTFNAPAKVVSTYKVHKRELYNQMKRKK